MHTEAQPTDGPFPPASDPAERQQIAQYHAAMFPTRLALARWQSGEPAPQLHAGGTPDAAPALSVAWHAKAGRDFQAWLDRGGFSQHDEAPRRLPPSPPNPAFWVPAREGDPRLDGELRDTGACSGAAPAVEK